MSQAVVDFCEGLKTTLLGLEDSLGKARKAFEAGAAQAGVEARKHVDEAAEQLATFKAHAGVMAEAIRADLPKQTEGAAQTLKGFGQEAQVAMRHAVVFLAEAAAKGADNAADVLKAGAKSAHRVADDLRHDTAVSVVPEQAPQPPT